MKKNKIIVIISIAALCLIGLIVFIIGSNNKNTNSQNPTTNNNSSNTEVSNSYKSACDVFTLEIAKKYLGENAAIGNTKASDSSTEGDNSINSSCLYDAGGDSLESRNIMLITAKNSTGQEWNKSEFENSPNELAKLTEDEPPKLTQIDNLGEKAYWNPQTGTLHVIISDGKYWLSVQGSIKDGAKEIEEHKNMATDIINNF